jgi:predicted molibdopterin-dependent oxidoreductase YjgC
MSPRNGKANWQIIQGLAQGFGEDFGMNSFADIMKEIRVVNRFYNRVQPGQFWGDNLFQNGFYTEDKKAAFSVFDVDITTQNPQKASILFSENFFRMKIKTNLMI